MNKKTTLTILLSILTVTIAVNFIFFFSSVKKIFHPQPVSAKIKVAASIFPVADMLKEIGGEDIEIITILPPGANVHTFEPSPADMKNIQGSAEIFSIGHGLDNWVTPLAQNAGISHTIILDKYISLRSPASNAEASSNEADPHYWLSIPNAEKISTQITEELVLLAPEKSTQIQQRAEAYKKELQKTDLKIRQSLQLLAQKNIATFHNAWEYFAQEYGLHIATSFEEYSGKEPTPAYLAQFQKIIQKNKVQVIFTEPQSSSTLLEPLAKDLGARLVPLDDMGGTNTQNSSYILLMLQNTQQIISATQP
jgi:zinc transport system substrate-binding protein